MKIAFIFCVLVVFASALWFSCQRPISPEAELPSAGFLLKDNNGNCKPIIVSGNHIMKQDLADSNFLEVGINVTFPGTYTITTDTVNGYFFKANGAFTNEGIFTIKLLAFGNPI